MNGQWLVARSARGAPYGRRRAGCCELILAADLPVTCRPVRRASTTATVIVSVATLAGFVVLIVFMALEGTKGPNRYGPDPKSAQGAPATAVRSIRRAIRYLINQCHLARPAA